MKVVVVNVLRELNRIEYRRSVLRLINGWRNVVD